MKSAYIQIFGSKLYSRYTHLSMKLEDQELPDITKRKLTNLLGDDMGTLAIL